MSFDKENRNESELMKRIAPLFYRNAVDKKQSQKDESDFNRMVSTYEMMTPGHERRVTLNSVEFLMDHSQTMKPEPEDILCIMYRYHIDNLFHYSLNTPSFNFTPKEMNQIGSMLELYKGTIPRMLDIEKIDTDCKEDCEFNPDHYDSRMMDIYRLEAASNIQVNLKCFQTYQSLAASQRALHQLNMLGQSARPAVQHVMNETMNALLDSHPVPRLSNKPKL